MKDLKNVRRTEEFVEKFSHGELFFSKEQTDVITKLVSGESIVLAYITLKSKERIPQIQLSYSKKETLFVVTEIDCLGANGGKCDGCKYKGDCDIFTTQVHIDDLMLYVNGYIGRLKKGRV